MPRYATHLQTRWGLIEGRSSASVTLGAVTTLHSLADTVSSTAFVCRILRFTEVPSSLIQKTDISTQATE